MARMAAAVVVAGVALGVLTVARGSVAQAPVFDVAEGCGSEREFRDELERLVGADAPRAMPTLLRIGRDGTGGDYRLTLEVAGQARALTHADCRVLFRSAVVVAAASVRAESAPAPAPASAPTPAPASASVPAAPPPSPSPSPRGPRPGTVRPELALGVGVAAGVVPRAAGTFELRAGLATDSFGFSLATRYYPARSVDVEGRGAEIQGLGFRVAGSVKPLPGLVASLGLDADWLLGRGDVGIALPGSDSAWTLGPSAEVAVIPFRTNRLAIELAAGGRLALLRPVFEVTGFRDLYQVPRWGGALLARGAWRFP